MNPCGKRAPGITTEAGTAAQHGHNASESCNGPRFTTQRQLNTGAYAEQRELGTPNFPLNPAESGSIATNPCGFRAPGWRWILRRLGFAAGLAAWAGMAMAMLVVTAHHESGVPVVDVELAGLIAFGVTDPT